MNKRRVFDHWVIPKNNKSLLRHRTYVEFVVNYKYVNGVFPSINDYLLGILPFLRALGVNKPTDDTNIEHQLFHPIFYGMLEFNGSVITPTKVGLAFMLDTGNAFLAEETYLMFNNATFGTAATGSKIDYDSVYPIKNLFENLVKYGELTFEELNTKFYSKTNGFDIKKITPSTKKGQPKWAYALSMLEEAGLITSSGKVLNISSKSGSYNPHSKIFPTSKLISLYHSNSTTFISQFDIDINEIDITKVIDNAHVKSEGGMDQQEGRDSAAQASYRGLLLAKFNHKCVVCGISHKSLLVASHIKPYSRSSTSEQFDVNNGLILCSQHDRLFDRGLITFVNGKMVFSPVLTKDDIEIIKQLPSYRITTNNETEQYLKYHHEEVFVKKT